MRAFPSAGRRIRSRTAMAHVVTEPCDNCNDTVCVVVCPAECCSVEPTRLFINPEECIDCEACVHECPVEAIYHQDNVPEQWESYTELNRVKTESGDLPNIIE